MYKKLFALMLLPLSLNSWAETTSSLTTGIDYSTGKYGGTTSTNIIYVPVTGKIQSDIGYLKLTVPYISVSSVDSVVRGIGKFQTASSNKIITQAGLGDIIATAAYTFFENDSFLLDLVGNIKFGTADVSKNLGTGEKDYSAQIDGFYTVDKTTTFATAGYKIVGAPPGITVNNIAYGTVGFSQKHTDQTSFGAMIDAAQSSSSLSAGTRELSVFASQKLSKTLKAQVSLMKGFSDSSPDFGGSLMVTGTIQ
jgi:hypothetical protein